MTTEAAPLLRAEMLDDVDGLVQLLDPGEESNGELLRALQALADGRTACVRVLTEDEHRAEFEKTENPDDLYRWGPVDWDDPRTGQYRAMSVECAWRGYLACARAMGAVR